MARRSLPSASSRTDPPLRLVDVDIVEEAEDVSDSTRINGDDVATLLDVTTETNRLLNPEDISLELEHVADLLAALADDAPPPTSGALTVAERCLRRLAARVDALRPGARSRAHRFVITPGVREMLRDYTVRWAPSDLRLSLYNNTVSSEWVFRRVDRANCLSRIHSPAESYDQDFGRDICFGTVPGFIDTEDQLGHAGLPIRRQFSGYVVQRPEAHDLPVSARRSGASRRFTAAMLPTGQAGQAHYMCIHVHEPSTLASRIPPAPLGV